MIEQNKPNKLPSKLKWYFLVRVLIILLFIPFLFYLVNKELGRGIFSLFLVFLSPPLFLYLIYLWIYFSLVTFVIENDKITINSGILTKRSKSIPFNRVQNVEVVKGLLQRFFGLCTVNIWTASPAQVEFSKKEITRRPDATLYLTIADGEWLRDFITARRS